MSVHEKLNKARRQLHAKGMKMTGKNKFADYEYFELGDFIPDVITICDEVGIIPLVSFAETIATMEVIDTTDGSKITFTSPMSTAQLKGCHPVQNLGAVETYVRRYLYQTAFEIVEHDALNATQGADKPKQLGKPWENPRSNSRPKLLPMNRLRSNPHGSRHSGSLQPKPTSI